MDLFGSGAAPREHRERRVVTGDDAWAAAAVSGDFDLGSVNREAARRGGLPERVVGPAWAALALEALALRAFGEGARVVALDLRYRLPLPPGLEVDLVLTPLAHEGAGERARCEVRAGERVLVEGTLRVRFEGAAE